MQHRFRKLAGFQQHLNAGETELFAGCPYQRTDQNGILPQILVALFHPPFGGERFIQPPVCKGEVDPP